ncbi:MAG: HD domain-containing phosphohydrolase [Anaerolineae bacterium]
MTRILLVEDNEQNLYLLQALLKGNGYQTTCASNGAEALEQARYDPPDLIISDILMPVMDGFALCREWKKDERLKPIPFIFYTATYTDARDENLAFSLGAARFIRKPTEPDEFMTILREVVEQAETGRLVAPPETLHEDKVYFKEYNAALIRKLEDKMLELERANRALELEIAERKRTGEQLERLFSETRRRVEQLTALRTIDLAISSSFDLRMTLDLILSQVTVRLGVDAAAVQLLRRHAQTLEYAASRGFLTSQVTRPGLRLGEGYAGRAALQRRVINIPNLAQDADGMVKTGVEREKFVGYCVAPLMSKGELKGILEVYTRTPLTPDPDWLSFFEALAGQAAIAVENAELFEGLQRSNAELALAYDTTLEGWSHALDLRDRETEGHTLRVTKLTLDLARAIGFNEAELVPLRRGALLHDIGKMGIPDSILLKRGALSEAEWKIMRQHPQFAYEMLLPITYLHPALEIPYCHHEKWDGTGYPRGLRGEEIPLAARIFAVVDVYDALRSDRPYRAALSGVQARDYVREQANKHFDPRVVEVFLREIAE